MKKIVWLGLLTAGLFWAGSEAQAKFIPGTSNSLPKLVTSHGTYTLGKKPYPAGTRAKWIAEGRALQNLVHSSDCPEEAAREQDLWFA